MSSFGNADLNELEAYKEALDKTAIVAITDVAGSIIYVNDQFCDISKYSREELLGKNHRIINSGHHPKSFFNSMWKTISSGKIWRGEVKNRAKDGTYYWVDTTIIPFKNEASLIYQYVAIRADITERKKLESEVLRQDRLASVGILSSGLAHEIGTPMGVIRGRAELLLDSASEDNSRRSLKIIIQQIDRITQLISTLLRISRKSESTHKAPVLVHDVVQEVLSLLEEKLRQRNALGLNEIPQNLTVLADENGLQQVFINLIINGLHAIEAALELGRKGEHKIVLSAEEDEKETRIFVGDTGTGIGSENLDKIFQAFYTTKDVGQGTGLGLTIVDKLISEMRGSITIKSELGKGTQFCLHFPKSD